MVSWTRIDHAGHHRIDAIETFSRAQLIQPDHTERTQPGRNVRTGMVFAQKPARLKTAMADILEKADADLTPQMRNLIDMPSTETPVGLGEPGTTVIAPRLEM